MTAARTIPAWGYLREYESERDEILAAVDGVFRSGRLILGRHVEAFEREFAAFCGAAAGVGVASGTDALFLALRALGIGAGDEVITVANTAVPTVAAIVSTGATPRFVDIDPATYLMDARALDAAVTPRTRCLLPVHLFGQCADMAAVRRVAERHGLSVLEDCAHAHGARQDGRRCGALGDAAAFSFYPTKVLGGYGDAGLVTATDEKLAARVRTLRGYGMDAGGIAQEHGWNSRLDEVHAALLRRKLTALERAIARRHEIAGRYAAALAGTGLGLPAVVAGNDHVYYLYVVRHPRRDEIVARLAARGIVAGVSYAHAIHAMPAYGGLARPGSLPHTEAAAREIFTLPMYPSLTDQEVDDVCRTLLGILADLAAGKAAGGAP